MIPPLCQETLQPTATSVVEIKGNDLICIKNAPILLKSILGISGKQTVTIQCIFVGCMSI